MMSRLPVLPSKIGRSSYLDPVPSPFMQNPDGNDLSGGMNFFITHPSREVDVSHYFRQIMITQRRHAPWVNLIWCRNRQVPTKTTMWKP